MNWLQTGRSGTAGGAADSCPTRHRVLSWGASPADPGSGAGHCRQGGDHRDAQEGETFESGGSRQSSKGKMK